MKRRKDVEHHLIEASSNNKYLLVIGDVIQEKCEYAVVSEFPQQARNSATLEELIPALMPLS